MKILKAYNIVAIFDVFIWVRLIYLGKIIDNIINNLIKFESLNNIINILYSNLNNKPS